MASPTKFPFEVAHWEGSISEADVYSARPRIFDLGYLREPYRTAAGATDYRCPAEPVTLYVAKGGSPENTIGRKCLCNALMANIDHPQVRSKKYVEKGLGTYGDDLTEIVRFLPADGQTYSAADVVAKLING